MFIKNRSQLESKDLDKNQSYLRRIALNSLEKALTAVKPENLVEKSLKLKDSKLIINSNIFDLKDFNNIYIIGGGKASAKMLLGLEKILKNFPNINYKGIINIPEGLEIKESEFTGKIKFNYASHPIPNENGLNGTRFMMELIEKSNKKDLFFSLISGGGSALLPLPKANLSIDDLKKVNSLLLASGVSIHEINTIRKHLSDFKGGNLARKLYNSSGATMISLIISDVVGDDLDSIASGPTVPDLTTFKDAIQILKKSNIFKKIPISIKNILERGFNKEELENPKPNDVCFSNVYNYLIGSIKFAAQEILSYLKQQTFKVEYFLDRITGEAKEFGKHLYPIISQKLEENAKKDNSDKIAFIGSGELTVTIKGNGIGGRNQEMLLSFLDFIKDKNLDHNFCIVAANLDGIEGNSKSMGAIVDKFTLNQVVSKNLDTKKYLENNDSNSFFKALRSEIITGPTGINVNDLLIILIIPVK